MRQLQMFSSPVMSLRDFVRSRLIDLPMRQRARDDRRRRRRAKRGSRIAGGRKQMGRARTSTA
jgi:hypothetical protein